MMTPYLELSAHMRNSMSFWSILLILGFLMIVIRSFTQRRYVSTGISVLSVITSYVLMQMFRNVTAWKLGEDLHPIAAVIGKGPAWLYVLVLLGLSVLFLGEHQRSLSYRGTHITSMAVKEAVDQNSTGICYYRQNGQLILTNHRMNELAFTLTGRVLLNGLELYEQVRDKHMIEFDDGTVVRFSHREIRFDREICYELIADDITELYRKSETLRSENEHLQLQNQRMKAYGETIDDTVRRQEILNTKTHIHDEMNRLLLSTENAIRNGNEEEKQRILDTWHKNVVLLCMEAGNDVNNAVFDDLSKLAEIIGVRIHYEHLNKSEEENKKQVLFLSETEDTQLLQLFSLATEEALTNAAKHADAGELYVQVCEDPEKLTVTYTNDGAKPEGSIREGGGLTTLRRRLEEAGGEMIIQNVERFVLTAVIPKGGNQYGL